MIDAFTRHVRETWTNRWPLARWAPLAALALTSLALAALAGAARANPANLVVNGSFESFSPSASGSCKPAQTITSANTTPWNTTSGYSFVITSANYSSFCGVSGNLGLYGPITASPDGGNFVASDGAYMTGYIYQTISGLVPGSNYLVSFDWAAAQQSGYTGNTSDFWQVGLGSAYGVGPFADTPTIQLPSATFSGWVGQQISLMASATSEVLWFFAVGTPTGQPPFALLDGVNVTVSEPPAAALVIVGLLGLMAVRRGSRRRA